MELTPERLQSIAIDCVTQFMNKQASLSEAIAKEAQCLELNSEQTKRVIEATNTIAYLRQLEKAADRTFEFPVADYGDVMTAMCVPDMQKAASDESEEDDDEEKEDKKEEKESDSEEKEEKSESKEETKDEDEEKKEQQEKVAMLTREFFRAKSNLEKIACDKIDLHLRLSAAASILHKDPQGLEKLAEVVAEDDFQATTTLCGLEKRACENLVFTDRELDSARTVYSLYKEAQELVKTEAEITDFVKRAERFF